MAAWLQGLGAVQERGFCGGRAAKRAEAARLVFAQSKL